MDPFELLKADHKKVAQLFDQLEAGSGQRKLDVFKQIKGELEVHTHIEETVFYPALEKPEETHDLTLEAYEEHNVVKTLLEELSGARSADDEWQAKAKVLRENVEHHVDEEENELFDKAEDALSSEQLEALGDRMAAEKARKQGKTPPAKKAVRAKAGPEEPGLISRIANVMGLGASEKKATKKKPAKKVPAKTAARKTARKSAKKSAIVSKRASTSIARKRAAGKLSVGKSKSRAKSGKKSSKKR